MRIAFVEVWPNSIVKDFANSFARVNRNAEVSVIFDRDSGREGTSGFDRRIRRIPLENARHIKNAVLLFRKVNLDLLYLQAYPKLEETLDSIKPDLVQSNLWINPYSVQAARWCRKNHVPFILRTEMQRFPAIGRKLTRLLMRITHKTVFDTARLIIPWTAQGEGFARREFPVPAGRIARALPPGIDLKRFKHYPWGKNRSGKAKFVIVQRFFPYKNYRVAVEAADILKKAGYTGFEITFKGSGPLRKEIETLVKGKNLEGVIRFDDNTYANMARFYSRFDALILPSKGEAIGLVVPEAMACGLGIIVSDTAGAQVYTRPGRNALVCRTGDPHDLAGKIRQLTKAKARRFGRESIKIARQYSLEETARKYGTFIKPYLYKRDKR